MIQLLFGTDREAGRQRLKRLRREFLEREPGGVVFRFEDESFDPGRFEELLFAQGLFGKQQLVIGRDLLAQASIRDFILTRLEALARSPSDFIFWERRAEKGWVGAFVAAGGMAEELVVKASRIKNAGFNLFSLANALGERDRRGLWVLYRRALSAGFSAEDVFWKLVWQVKVLLMLKRGAALARYQPRFVGKLKRQAAAYAAEELESLSFRLAELWHRVKIETGRNLEVSLERLILEI